MPEQETIIEQKQEVVEQPPAQLMDVWGDPVEVKKEEVVEQKKEEPIIEKKVEEEIVEPNVWLEREFGWKDAQSAKAEIEELRKLKAEAKTPEEIKFASDESKRLFEALKEGKEDDVYEILETKRKFSQIEKLNVDDAKQAAQLLQLNYQLKYKDLTQSEIYDLFEEQYAKPDKPKQDIQTDDEYQELLQKWQARCDAIDRKIVRDAKIAKPDVLSLKPQIAYPDIKKPQEEVKANEPTPEEQENARKFKEQFLQAANKTVNELKGFTAQVKDKDVDYSVSYVPSNEEKLAVEASLKSFAEVGFNANNLLAQRWVNEDRSLNVNRIAEDIAFLNNKDKILEKVANEAANQRIELFLKEKKNVNLNQDSVKTNFNPNGKTEQQQIADAVWGV